MSLSKTRTYKSWYSMHAKHRTEICAEWGDYQTFRADMGEKPSGREIVLCRRNHRQPYSASNCYWGRKNNNGRLTVLVRAAGETLCLSEWARRLRTSQQRLSTVKRRRGLSGLQTYVAGRFTPRAARRRVGDQPTR